MQDTSQIITYEVIARIDLDNASVCLRSDGILHMHITEELLLDLKSSEALVDASEKLCGDRKYPCLVTTEKFVTPSKEAIDYVAGKGRTYLNKADAFVLHSLPQKLIGNFYLKFKKPEVLTKMFSDEEKATFWLYNFV